MDILLILLVSQTGLKSSLAPHKIFLITLCDFSYAKSEVFQLYV